MGDLLGAEGFSLQGNAKTVEGRRHPDRDAQFRYINEQVKARPRPDNSLGRGGMAGYHDRVFAFFLG